MTPPINIDGTQITGASIDGQTVNEITVDGQTAFSGIPDSLVYYRANDESLSNGAPVNTITDQQGSEDLTGGSPSYVASDSDIDGRAAFDFGSGDVLDTALSSGLTQPFTLFVVARAPADGTNHSIWDNEGTGGRTLIHVRQGSNDYLVGSGSFQGVGTPTTNYRIHTLVADGSNSEFRLDGSTVFTGNLGSNGVGGIRVGQDNIAGRQLTGRWAEGYVVDGTNRVADEEQRLSSFYNITI